jgi:hypothetical protein
MNSVQIGRRITNNFGADAAPMPASQRSISNRCVCHVSCCVPPDKILFRAVRMPRQDSKWECRTATLSYLVQVRRTQRSLLRSCLLPSVGLLSHQPCNASRIIYIEHSIANPSTNDDPYMICGTWALGSCEFRPEAPPTRHAVWTRMMVLFRISVSVVFLSVHLLYMFSSKNYIDDAVANRAQYK